MRISTKVRYALRATVELALHWGQGPIMAETIARRQELSRKYLESLLLALKNGRVLSSVRGVGGGWTLARPPGEITVEDVYRAVEGNIVLLECVENPDSCSHIKACPTHEFWEDLTHVVVDKMRSVTILALAEHAREKSMREYMYYI